MRWPLRRVLVQGPSMAPALRHGDVLLVWLRRPRRLRPGDVVVAHLPSRPLSVKRVRRVDAAGAVWLEGDNAFGSTDSRSFGAVASTDVVGRVVARLWPRPGYVRRSP